jgi:hypothetical protein
LDYSNISVGSNPMKKAKTALLGATGIAVIAAGVFGYNAIFTKALLEDPSESTTSLYLNVVIHTEEDTSKCTTEKGQIPDYDDNEIVLLHSTMVMREFAELAASHGVKINFGSDWTFSNGVENFDPTFYSDIEAMGHEVDAHAHESCILYHEVYQDIIDAGGTPTNVASGHTEGSIYERMTYFDKYYPAFQTLWGVALAGHGEGEEIAGWVWRPSRDNWLQHDPDGDYIYIGHGEQINSLNEVQNAIANINPDYINTYAVFTNPRQFKAAEGTEGIPEEWTVAEDAFDYWENRLRWWDNFFTELDQLENLTYASLTEVADIFIENEEHLNLDFDTEMHPRSNASAGGKQEEAGYMLNNVDTKSLQKAPQK